MNELVVKPKVDIVLSNGMFLRRGFEYNIFVNDNELAFISPYASIIQAQEKQQDDNKIDKPRRGRKPIVKNELA